MPLTFTNTAGLEITFESSIMMYEEYFRCHLWLGKIPYCDYCDHKADCTTLDQYFYIAYKAIERIGFFDDFDEEMSKIFSRYDEYLAEYYAWKAKQELVYTGRASAFLGTLDAMFS